MFCSTSLTVSRTNSRTNVTPNRSKLLSGSDIVQLPVRNWGWGEGGGYGPEEKFTHFHCQNLAGLSTLLDKHLLKPRFLKRLRVST